MVHQPAKITLFGLSSLLLLVACGQPNSPAGPSDPTAAASAKAAENAARFIVVFDRDVPDAPGLARRLVAEQGATLHHTYEHAIKGMAATMSNGGADVMRARAGVAYIERDAEVRLYDTQLNTPSWGIDRIDQRGSTLDDSYSYGNDGSGANVYIFDSGIRPSHLDFGGRASFVDNGNNGDFVGDTYGDNNGALDCHGHGTHVAGSAAGGLFGVAKGADIFAARVVNCSGGGNVSMAIAAVDWATANAVRPAVVNMSLGYGNVQSLRDAVNASVAAGVNYAVAAGNGNFAGIPIDACTDSPAGAAGAVTVGATADGDTEASFSNYGTCVDILAPGVSIVSDYYSADNAIATMSGTSMASPHVAGAIALYLTATPGASPAQVANALTTNATSGAIRLHRRSRKGGTPNLLLYTGFLGGGVPTPNSPPTAGFTESCNLLECDFSDASSDTDGTVDFFSWTFGDGGTSTAKNPSHTYGSAGSYLVTLVVTDDSGGTGSVSREVTVTDQVGGGFTLSTNGYKVRGRQAADLTWSGAAGTEVDIWRGGSVMTTTANDGFYTDNIGSRGGGSYSYKVCEKGSTTSCSNISTVTF